MSEAKDQEGFAESVHTAGPWVVCINSIDQQISIEQDRESLEQNGDESGEPVVVVMCVDDMGEGLDREIGLANAHLIAEAPEMFRIIRRLATADWIGESEINLWRRHCREIIQRVSHGHRA